MSSYHRVFLALFFLVAVPSGAAYGAESDGSCEAVPVVEIKGQYGSSTFAPLFDEQAFLLALPAGAHDENLVVLASIKRSAENLLVQIGLQEP